MEIQERNREKGNGIFRIGPIRPPSEADSLLIQITNGCTWNRCKFCQLYRHTDFRAYSVDSILDDIDEIAGIIEDVERYRHGNKWDLEGLDSKIADLKGEAKQCFYMVATWYLSGSKKVFLQDGNSIILRGGKLATVLQYLKKKLPMIERITTYGRAQNLSVFQPEDFVKLHESGLDCIHSGFETGSDEVLQLVNKGTTQEQQIKAGKMITDAGIELSVYFMPGLGGHELSLENARGTVEVVNACHPNYLRIRTAAVKPGTGLEEDWKAGVFSLATEEDKLSEIRYLVEHADFDGQIVSDHMINLLQDVEGHCQRDRQYMLGLIDEYNSMPEMDRKMYQLMRRSMHAQRPADLAMLSAREKEIYGKLVEETSDEQWTEKMNAMISRYI